jgi:hypothetical protein
MRLACLALWGLYAFGQPAKPGLEVANAYASHSLLSFAPPVELPWERILRSHAAGINLDHPSGVQLGWIKKNPVYSVETLTGYEFCATVPLDPSLRKSAFWLIWTGGMMRIQVSGMRVCAEFGLEDQNGLHPRAYSGSILAAIPGKVGDAGTGFVIRTDGTAPSVLPTGKTRFAAAFAGKGNRRTISCTYSEEGSLPAHGELEAKARESLQSWFVFRLPSGVYGFVVWKGVDGTCERFYSLFRIGSTLSEIGEGGDGCDV